MSNGENPRSHAGDRVRRALLTGVAISGLSMLFGLAIVLLDGAERPEGPPPPLVAVLKQAVRLDGRGLLNFGLLALMVTPLVRVVILALSWTAEGDRRFAGVAFAVLALLGMSLWYGIG